MIRAVGFRSLDHLHETFTVPNRGPPVDRLKAASQPPRRVEMKPQTESGLREREKRLTVRRERERAVGQGHVVRQHIRGLAVFSEARVEDYRRDRQLPPLIRVRVQQQLFPLSGRV
ncbi:hypothetical protein F2P81_004056 [Scophthalmus maximus]|uniref:Uncharacterized protein n=1 Tax=Scophthalmus maximus TaxID=52904 RepID=A0A6A4TCV9_SCOMX|nr:hypothetical protein F2P81_004056 [Scophthalmus maximus]